MTTPLTWHDVLAEEKQQPYFINTLSTVAAERQAGQTIYPPQKDVFNGYGNPKLRFARVGVHGNFPLACRAWERGRAGLECRPPQYPCG